MDAELAALRRPAGADLYRELLASYAAGVCVVTAFADDGSPRGLTLIAFCGVSLDPPLVLACIDRSSNTLPAIRASGGFTVNFVSGRSRHVARLMATKEDDKFASLRWAQPSVRGAGPVLLDDAVAHVLCRTWRSLEAGDHWVLVGEVVGGAVSRSAQPPLVFHLREFVPLATEPGRE